jgi:hypothetical protein
MAESSKQTAVRAVTIPVACPFGDDPSGKPWTWQSFGERLNEAFRLSTDLANWAQGELARRDVRRTPDMERLPPFDPAAVYGTVPRRFARKAKGGKPAAKVGDPMVGSLYDLFNRECPFRGRFEFATPTAQLILRRAEKDWKDHQDHGRYAVIWKGDARAMYLRYPQPFPVHNENWHPEYERGKSACVTLNLPGVGPVSLALKTRADFRRQLAMFRQLCLGHEYSRLKGEANRAKFRAGHPDLAEKGEAAFYRNGKGDVLLKMVGHFPKRERGPAVNAAFICTDPNALLVVDVNGRPAKVTNGDHIVREVAKHRTFLQRAAEDKKREVRMDRRQRANFNRAIEARCDKQADRVKTAVKQVAAQVARMCERMGVGLVAYDDSRKEFIPDGFAWHALKQRLRQVVEGELGCRWIDKDSPSFGEGFTRLKDQEEKLQWMEAVQKAMALAAAGRKTAAHAKRPGSHPAVSRRPATSSTRPGTRSKNSSTTPSPTSKRRARSSTA